MKFSIRHTTKYIYESLVGSCRNQAILKPLNLIGQTLVHHQLLVNPEPLDFLERTDFFGNNVASFAVRIPHTELEVTANSIVERDFSKIKSIYSSPKCKSLQLDNALQLLNSRRVEFAEERQFIYESPLILRASKPIKEYAEKSFRANRSVFDASNELMERIFSDFEFDSDFTDVATPVDEAFENRKGVCQDFAQIALSCIRSVGLPARYVSGYLETLPPEGQEKLIGVDASHAWFSVYIPDCGWVDFDATNNIIPQDQHITVALGRDYKDVAPLKGVIYTSGKNIMEVAVDIRRM